MQDIFEAAIVLLARRHVKQHCLLHPRHSRMLLELVRVVEALIAHCVSDLDAFVQISGLCTREPHVGFFILGLFDAGELLHDHGFRPVAVAGDIVSKPNFMSKIWQVA